MLCFPKLISHFPVPLSRLPEHKIGIFVRFLPSEPSFSGFLSTKSVFLCQKEQFSPGFCPFRAQNRGFCALVLGNMASGSRKARKFFLHAFKLLLPVGNCLWGTAARAPGHLGTGEPGNLSIWAPLNRGTACGALPPEHLGTWAPGTWNLGTGAPWHRSTVKPWNCGTLGTVEPWNCLRGNCPS